VHKAGHDHVGFRKGINYLGKMYFSSANSKTGAKVRITSLVLLDMNEITAIIDVDSLFVPP